MKRLILSAAVVPLFSFAAYAADLPTTKGPPVFTPPPPPVFSWTGFYVGAQVGYEWGTSDPYFINYPSGTFGAPIPSYTDSGVVGGLHAGYNYQIDQFVLGIEGDIEGSSYSGSTDPVVDYKGAIVTYTAGTQIPIQGSVRGRIGWTWNRVLIYATGGVAFGDVQNSLSYTYFVDPYISATNGRVGWTVGGGVEYALDPNWSVRLEYRYTDYGTYDFVLYAPPFDGDAAIVEHERDNRVEAGFSYKFDMFAPPAPVVAKY